MLESLDKNPLFSGGLTLMAVGSAVAMLRNLPARLAAFIERRLSISLDIPDRDPAFRWIQAWLATHPYAKRARDLSLTTTWERSQPDASPDAEFDFDESSGPAGEAKFELSPAPGIHFMIYRKRILVVRRMRRDLQNGGSTAYQETLTLQLFGGSRRMLEELLGEARAASFPKVPGVSILNARNECWFASSWQPKRPLPSLILADEILEDLIADLRDFYRSSSWYAERGVPFRRGYLLHGPPGTGKTTLVLALAGELGLSVAVLTLSSRLMSDESLRALVDALPLATILLIEDVDCVFRDKRATTQETGVTLSGLLNALDGVSSRDGRVLFLTTNHLERLDPALIRPGRVDRRVELAYATPDQARRLFLWFFRDSGLTHAELAREADGFATQVPDRQISMAAIQEHLLRHRRSPEAAAREVVFERSTPTTSAACGWVSPLLKSSQDGSVKLDACSGEERCRFRST
jgi:predicted ATPase